MTSNCCKLPGNTRRKTSERGHLNGAFLSKPHRVYIICGAMRGNTRKYEADHPCHFGKPPFFILWPVHISNDKTPDQLPNGIQMQIYGGSQSKKILVRFFFHFLYIRIHHKTNQLNDTLKIISKWRLFGPNSLSFIKFTLLSTFSFNSV